MARTRAETLPAAGIDPDLAALVERLKSLDPAARPPAGEVLARLDAVTAKPERQRRRRRRLLGAAAALAVLAGTAYGSWRIGRPAPLLPPGETARIALLPFRNATGDPHNDWVELGLMELVARTLDRTERVEVVPPAEVVETMKALGMAGAEAPSAGDLARLARAGGSRFVVATVVRPESGGFRADFSVHDEGASLGERSVAAAELTQLGGALARGLSQRLDPDAAFAALEQAFSSDAYANRTYAMGSQRLSTEGPLAAEPYFAVCLDRDPAFLRAKLQRAECRYRLSQWDEAERIGEEVRQAARAAGDRQLEADALMQRGRITLERGDYPGATAFFEGALPLLEALGDGTGKAVALNRLGIVAYRRGEAARATELLTAGLALARRHGVRRLEPPTLTPLAYLALNGGDVATAGRLLREALAIDRTLGNREGIAGTLLNLANFDLREGRQQQAQARTREALAIFRRLGNERGVMIASVNLGALAEEARDVAGARAFQEEAHRLALALGDRRTAAYARAEMGRIDAKQGRLEAAERTLDEVQAIAAELGDHGLKVLGWQNLAYLRVRQERLGEAAALLDRVRTAAPGDRLTRGIEARLAYARGDYAGAVQTLEEAKVTAGAQWTVAREATLRAYRQAAATARAVPVPDER